MAAKLLYKGLAMQLLIIRADDIEQLDYMPKAIAALKEGFKDLHNKQVQMLPRTLIYTDQTDPHRQLSVLTAACEKQNVSSVKITTLTPQNKSKKLPLIQGLVGLVDLENGQMSALLDGAHLTAVRTGAMSGLATDIFASKSACTLCMIGCGKQARSLIKAMIAVRPIKTVTLWSRTNETANEFKDWIVKNIKTDLNIEAHSNPHDAVRNADIICTSTSTGSSEPIVHAQWIKPGAHINVIGGVTDDACEVEASALKDAYVIVEQKEAALSEAGEVRTALKDQHIAENDIIEIGEVLCNNVSSHKKQMTLFRSVGVALQDTVVAKVVYDLLKDKNICQSVSF